MPGTDQERQYTCLVAPGNYGCLPRAPERLALDHWQQLLRSADAALPPCRCLHAAGACTGQGQDHVSAETTPYSAHSKGLCWHTPALHSMVAAAVLLLLRSAAVAAVIRVAAMISPLRRCRELSYTTPE